MVFARHIRIFLAPIAGVFAEWEFDDATRPCRVVRFPLGAHSVDTRDRQFLAPDSRTSGTHTDPDPYSK